MRYDVAIAFLILLLGAIYAWLRFSITAGLPEMDVYYQADFPKIYENLNDLESKFRRVSNHPLFIWVCIANAHLVRILELDPTTALLLFSAFVSSITLMLFFVLGRQIGLPPFSAVVVTALYASSGSFMLWSAYPETHILGATSCLATLVLFNWWYRRSTRCSRYVKILLDGVLFALAGSMVITNALLILFSRVNPFFLRRTQIGKLAKVEFLRIPRHLLVIGFGTLILQLALVGAYQIILNNSMGRLYNLRGELPFLLDDKLGGYFDSVLSLGILAPSLAEPSVLPLLFGAAAFILVLFMFPRVTRKTTPLLLMVLFGVVLHFFYSRADTFLYSPNYGWAAILLIGLLLHERARSLSIPLLILLVVAFGTLNLMQYMENQEFLEASDSIWLPLS